jgi:hypothetical protein
MKKFLMEILTGFFLALVFTFAINFATSNKQQGFLSILQYSLFTSLIITIGAFLDYKTPVHDGLKPLILIAVIAFGLSFF